MRLWRADAARPDEECTVKALRSARSCWKLGSERRQLSASSAARAHLLGVGVGARGRGRVRVGARGRGRGRVRVGVGLGSAKIGAHSAP